jgi:predicted permease
MRRAPWSTAFAILVLTLALGANVAVLSISDVVLFRPLPYSKSGQLYVLNLRDRQSGRLSPLVPGPLVEAIGRAEGFGGIAGRGAFRRLVHEDPAGADFVGAAAVSPSFFEVLGVDPFLGRFFEPQDVDAPEQRIVLSHACWQQRFGGNPGLVGKIVQIGGERRTVIGVLPPDFLFPADSPPVSAAQPGGMYEFVTVSRRLGPRGSVLAPVVRLNDATNARQAEAKIDGLIEAIRSTGISANLVPVRSVLFPEGQAVLWILLAGAAFVFALGATNVAQLLAARAGTRRRQDLVRVAIGGSRRRIATEAVAEAGFISMAAAVLALFIVSASFGVLRGLVPASTFGQAMPGVDWRVMACTALLALIVGAAGGLSSWWSMRSDDSLHQQLATRERTSPPRVLGPIPIGMQTGLAVILLIAAIAATGELRALIQKPLGVNSRNALIVQAHPRQEDSMFVADASRRLEEMPGVVAAGAADAIPLGSTRTTGRNDIRAGAGFVTTVTVTPGYFEAAGIRIARGRAPAWDDVPGGPNVVVLSRAGAEAIFGPGRPPGTTVTTREGRTLSVIGIVDDVRMALEAPIGPLAYSTPGEDLPQLTLIVRVDDSGRASIPDVRRTLSELDSAMPVAAERWQSILDAQAEFRTPRLQAVLLTSFAVVATLLAAASIFGSVSVLVSARQRELGVRLALGAAPLALLTLLLSRVGAASVTGACAGALLTWGVSDALAGLSPALAGADGSAYAVGLGVFLVAALAGAYIPARRAVTLDPLEVLRAE